MPPSIPEIEEQTLETGEAERPIDWLALLSTLWAWRKRFAYVTGFATVPTLIVSLLLPEFNKFTATLVFIVWQVTK